VKVLHIWNTAGVANTIAKYQAKLLGWNTWVLMRKSHDPFNMTLYGEVDPDTRQSFMPKALWILKTIVKSHGYDILHIHALDKILLPLKLLYPNKLIIMHYKGTDIRGRWRQRKHIWKHADLLLVSTPDLLEGAPSHAHYLPNPVDTELFKPMPHLRRHGALFIYDDKPKFQHSLKWALETAWEHGFDLYILHRGKTPIPYRKMPEFLNQFHIFIDHCYVPALSKTALEALACGLKVVRWDGKIIEGLPDEHRPENVVKQLTKLINEVIG